MHIFQLIPINAAENDEAWRSSIAIEPIILRSKTEMRARQMAAFVTEIAVIRIPGNKTPISPWYDSTLTKCEIYKGNEYNNDDIEKVLSPEWLKEEWDELQEIERKANNDKKT